MATPGFGNYKTGKGCHDKNENISWANKEIKYAYVIIGPPQGCWKGCQLLGRRYEILIPIREKE